MKYVSSFHDQSILITGASSGLGAEFARQLVQHGARVGLVARRADLLEDLAVELKGKGGTVATSVADVGDLSQIQAAVSELKNSLGTDSFDRVILNAGVGKTFLTEDFDIKTLEYVTRINYLGAANTISVTLPDMIRKRSGHIIGISSLSARRGLPLGFAYGASKAALTTLLEGMRVELRPQGVKVTVIHPGFIRTPMTANQTTPQIGLIDAQVAVQRMIQAIHQKKLQFNFPLITSFLTEALRRLPSGVSDRLVHHFVLRTIQRPSKLDQ